MCDIRGPVISLCSVHEGASRFFEVLMDYTTAQTIRHFVLTQQTYVVAAVFKDDIRYFNFVDPSSLSHHGLSFSYSSLGEQPSRRLWDNPVESIKRYDQGIIWSFCHFVVLKTIASNSFQEMSCLVT